MGKQATVSFVVDARSLRSMKKNVDIAMAGVAGCTKESIRDFCNAILFDAVQLVPIDTGALANSADFEIRGSSRKGYEARVGFGVGKRNPVNKRTGKPASSYAGIVHEQIGTVHQNGQAKFFEQALFQHEQELETKTGKAIRDYLSSPFVVPKAEVSDRDDSADSARNAAVQARMAESFTAQVEGKYLPFPVPRGMIYKKGSRWFLNHEFYKKHKDTRKKSVRKYKTTSKTARSIREKESARYMKKEAVVPKHSERAHKRTTSSVKRATKASSRQVTTSAKIRGTRTTANKKTTKKTFLDSSLRHETALDEYMQYLIDEGNAKKKEKKKKKGRYNGPIA